MKTSQLLSGNVTVRERLILMYYKLGENKKAKPDGGDQAADQPGGPGPADPGVDLSSPRKLDESIAELDLIVKAWPDDDKSRYYLASAYEERGNRTRLSSTSRRSSRVPNITGMPESTSLSFWKARDDPRRPIDVLEKAIQIEKTKSSST